MTSVKLDHQVLSQVQKQLKDSQYVCINKTDQKTNKVAYFVIEKIQGTLQHKMFDSKEECQNYIQELTQKGYAAVDANRIIRG